MKIKILLILFVLTISLETILFFSVGYFGYSLSENKAAGIFLAIIFIFISLHFWGRFKGRESPYRLPQPHRFFFTLLGFGVGASLLHTTGKTQMALVFIIAAIINEGVLLILGTKEIEKG